MTRSRRILKSGWISVSSCTSFIMGAVDELFGVRHLQTFLDFKEQKSTAAVCRRKLVMWKSCPLFLKVIHFVHKCLGKKGNLHKLNNLK